MQSVENINIPTLLGRPVWQMSGNEFCALVRYAHEGTTPANRVQAIGIHVLAEQLGCSASILYEMKKRGILDGSIISHIGKKVVFDVEKARFLANDYQETQRIQRQTEQ